MSTNGTNMEKIAAESMTIALHKSEFGGWGGVLVINGDVASECNAGNPYTVIHEVLSGAFDDPGFGSYAAYTLGEDE